MNSMTGYGKAKAEKDGYELTVEIKAVNHRYLDLNIKMPKLFSVCEDKIRKAVSERITRGHLDIYVSFSDFSVKKQQVCVDFSLAEQYVKAAAELSNKCGIENGVTALSLIRNNDVVSLRTLDEENDELNNMLISAVCEALESLNKMRAYEGQKLLSDMLSRLNFIKRNVEEIKEKAPSVSKEYAEKLRNRISELTENYSVDETRLATEIALFADRCNIDEELTRLFSHLDHFVKLSDSECAVGRQLDFLIQELNREVNTICSKSNNVGITNIGLVLKNEIEKIREQAQNIE